MRVTDLMLGSALTQDLQKSQSQLLVIQEQMASGQRIGSPSEDPVGAEQLLGLQAAISQNAQYLGNAQDGLSWLQASQSAMSGAINLATEVRTLALQAGSGTIDPSQRSVIASQMTALLGGLVDAGNTQLGGRYLFNGQQVGTAPFVLAGSSVSTQFGPAASQPLVRVIGPGSSLAVNPGSDQPASNVFQSSGTAPAGLLPAVSQMIADLQPGGSLAKVTGSDLAALDAALGVAENAQGQMGATMQRLQSSVEQLTSTQTGLTTQQGQVGGTDLAQAAVQEQELQTALQAAVAVGGKLMAPSLVNYLA